MVNKDGVASFTVEHGFFASNNFTAKNIKTYREFYKDIYDITFLDSEGKKIENESDLTSLCFGMDKTKTITLMPILLIHVVVCM